MRNPFEFGGIVNKESFCNRTKEISDVLSIMKAAGNIFLYGERRIGKTSLVKIALSELSKSDYLIVYVDLWPTEDLATFVATYAKALAESFNSKFDDMVGWAKNFLPALQPRITLNTQGHPEFSIGVSQKSITKASLRSILQLPKEMSDKRNKQVVVVFDEFQQMLSYDEDIVVRQLRSSIQDHNSVSYTFLGSRKHIIQSMLQDQRQPLFGTGGHYSIGCIALEHWLPFITQRFAQTRKSITEQQIKNLCEQTQGHPFYTQHLCNLAWELCSDGGSMGERIIDECIEIMLKRQGYAFETLWESLTTRQRRLLEGLAREQHPEIYSQDFIERYRLVRASSAQAAAQKLLERDIIDIDSGSYIISDRFFRLWISRTCPSFPQRGADD